MSASVIGLVLIINAAAAVQQAGGPQLVFERGGPSQYSQTDDIHELRSGPGWLRTPRLFSDFTLRFDFRLASPDTDAAVFIRTLTPAPRSSERWGESAYRMRLPGSAAIPPAGVLTAVRGNVRATTGGRLIVRPADEWQHVDITAEGRRVTATLNGELVGEFEIEHFAGHVIFEVSEGAARLRNVTITPAEHTDRGIAADTPSPRAGEPGVRWPRLLREVKPFYTPDAMRRKAQGVVVLDAVVLQDGSVGAVQVKRGVDPDLDQSAVASLRRWRFAPGAREGTVVPVVVEVEMSFTLSEKFTRP